MIEETVIGNIDSPRVHGIYCVEFRFEPTKITVEADNEEDAVKKAEEELDQFGRGIPSRYTGHETTCLGFLRKVPRKQGV